MAEAYEFTIVKALAARVSDNVRKANGYHHDIATVKLSPRHAVEETIPEANPPIGPPRPYAILKVLEESDLDYEEKGMLALTMPFDLILVDDIDDTDGEALLRSYYRLAADIETVLAKQTLGGLIQQLTLISRELVEPESSTIRVIVHGEVVTRRAWGEPNV